MLRFRTKWLIWSLAGVLGLVAGCGPADGFVEMNPLIARGVYERPGAEEALPAQIAMVCTTRPWGGFDRIMGYAEGGGVGASKIPVKSDGSFSYRWPGGTEFVSGAFVMGIVFMPGKHERTVFLWPEGSGTIYRLSIAKHRATVDETDVTQTGDYFSRDWREASGMRVSELKTSKSEDEVTLVLDPDS